MYIISAIFCLFVGRLYMHTHTVSGGKLVCLAFEIQKNGVGKQQQQTLTECTPLFNLTNNTHVENWYYTQHWYNMNMLFVYTKVNKPKFFVM